MRISCIFLFHKWEGRKCLKCGKARSESAHETATRNAVRKAAKQGDVNKVMALLKDKDHLVVTEDRIQGRFGSTRLGADAQRTVKEVVKLLAAKQAKLAQLAQLAKGLAALDSLPKHKLQSSQPRDAGMLASPPKPFRRW
jgi:hypothetical protein